ncbi:peroxidasin homolog isoform X3 [Salminus brasiliensis]|uniref:peroxidasin homolog isoform X3 n=1 Tax=Salminus brasiliensis TaxID=930266 RepID=UPI003B833563
MRVCVFCVFVVVLQLGEFVGYTLTDNCTIHISHESLLVEYGEPVEVNCSITTKPTPFILAWETTVNPKETSEETSLVWSVSSLTRWEVNTENLFCYLSALVEGGNMTQCKKPVQLTLYKRPDSVMIHSESDVWSEGELRNLTCEIKNVGPVCNLTVQWTRVDRNRTRTVINSSDVAISGNLGEGNVTDTLEVSAGRDEDGVQYQCAALLNLNLLEQPQVGVSQLLTISVHYKPTVTQPSSGSVSITKGDTLMVNCEAHGNPDPQYTWTRSSSTITNSSLLNISNVRSEHQGEYTCMASNSEGSASVKVTVNVTDKPTITQPSSGSVSITKGDTLMVNCKAHGNPDPQYTWTRSSSTITNSSLLNISNVRSEHQGEYTCMASNSEGSASVKVTVNVTDKPTITQPSSGSVSITKGDTLMVNCKAHGNPDPQYTWTRSSSTITNSSLLNISNVRSEHQGEYTCMASNSEGSASVKVTVNVTEDPLPIIASCVVVAVALLIAGLCTWFWKHYRHKQITSS